MVRRIDDTKVGEYKNNWFFEIVQLLISIAGCISVFLIPITFNVARSSEVTTAIGISPVKYLLSNPEINYVQILSLVIVSFFGFLLANIFMLIAIPKISKTVYVKISKIIEGAFALVCLALLGYYFIYLFNNGMINSFNVEEVYKIVIVYELIVGFALINSIFVCFTSKKVSIYD